MKRKKFADKETFEQNLDRRQVIGVYKHNAGFIPSVVHMDKPKPFNDTKSLWLRHHFALMKDRDEPYPPYDE